MESLHWFSPTCIYKSNDEFHCFHCVLLSKVTQIALWASCGESYFIFFYEEQLNGIQSLYSPIWAQALFDDVIVSIEIQNVLGWTM